MVKEGKCEGITISFGNCNVCDYMCVSERLCESGPVAGLAWSTREALAKKQMAVWCGGVRKGIRATPDLLDGMVKHHRLVD